VNAWRKTPKHLVFVNADEIARELASQDLTREQLDLYAARNMLARIDHLADAGADFMFETLAVSWDQTCRTFIHP
jgi:predicted ABC-type ATPase